MNDNQNSQTVSSQENVLSKVRKLLELAKNNSNENEMKAAMAVADRLMQEHRISQAMLQASDNNSANNSNAENVIITKVVSRGGRRTQWRETILSALTKHYGCCYYLSSGRNCEGKGVQSYTVVGTTSDIEMVELSFQFLEESVLRLGSWHSKGQGRAFGKAWQSGCADGIATQFRTLGQEQKSVADQNISNGMNLDNGSRENVRSYSTALAVLSGREAKARSFMRNTCGTKPAQGLTGGRDGNARSLGYNAGRSMNINSGSKKLT